MLDFLKQEMIDSEILSGIERISQTISYKNNHTIPLSPLSVLWKSHMGTGRSSFALWRKYIADRL